MARHLAIVLVAGILAFGAQAHAHHSFAATYLEDESVTIEGELVRILLRNPHSFVHVMVKNKDGSIVRYAVEWGGALQLGGDGVTRETLKPGDYVVITGTPATDPGDHRVRMLSLHRPKDGFGWAVRTGQWAQRGEVE